MRRPGIWQFRLRRSGTAGATRKARGGTDETKQTQQSTRGGTHNNTHIWAEGGMGVARGVGEEGGGEQGEQGERQRRRLKEEERCALLCLLFLGEGGFLYFEER